MSKHTPGPWLVTGGSFVYALNSYGTNSFWTNIYGGSQGGYKSPATPNEEIEANANLIAAAPDLLEAAILALDEMCNTSAPRSSFTDAVDALDAAIARAKGEPQ